MAIDIDITKYLGTIERNVLARERDGKKAWVVAASRTYDTDIDDLWDAISNPERLPRWFLPVSGDLRLGGRYQLEGNAGGEITGCTPPSRLELTWEFGGDTSWVQVALTKLSRDSTRLELEHVSHPPDDFWETYGPGAVGVGWELALVGLGENVAGAPAVDHKEAELWPTTPDGRQLVASASEGWGEAAIRAGTHPVAAKASAARTVAFYTGEEPPSAAD